MNRGPAVVDTNVVVAGLLTSDLSSPTARIVDAMLSARMVFVVSDAVVAEYRAVLLRPRIRRAHGRSEAEIDEILTTLVANALVRDPTTTAVAAPDPADQHLFDLVASVPGAVLITGDRALLESPSAATPTLNPNDWLGSGDPATG